jgi:hypothetical protein
LSVCNSKPRCRVSVFTSSWNRCHQRLSDIELVQVSAFSASYSRTKLCFISGKRTRVWICQTTLEHLKTTIFSSIMVPRGDQANGAFRWYHEKFVIMKKRNSPEAIKQKRVSSLHKRGKSRSGSSPTRSVRIQLGKQ